MERPGRTNRQIADALALAPATTRSVITFLRAWLGTAADGTKWLPDAHPGRGGYRTDDRVTSDWHQAQLLVGRAGINHANPEVLQQVLTMVRGKPLEGTIDWSSVDHLKSQISAFLEEASHQLTCHALDQGDLGLARWSNGQGLLADPESERLLTDKIMIADRAGDHDEVQRLIGKVSANARALELDLSDDTQDVLTALARS